MPTRRILKALIVLAVVPLAAACASGGSTPAPGGPVAASTPEMIAQGQQIFTAPMRCSGCHGPAAAGTGRGPNLTDDTWLWVQGNQPRRPQIVTVIRNGVAMPKVHMNGMPAFGTQLTEEQLQALAAYIDTL